MARKLISDMVAPEAQKESERTASRKVSPKISIPFGKDKKPGGDILKSLSLILLIAILILGLFFILTSYFSSAEVFTTSISQNISLDNLVSITKDKTEAGKIRYSLMTLEDSLTSTIPATGSKAVSSFSKGKVTLYNAYSSAKQLLASGTRLETSDGKIYKINNAVTIPGSKGTGVNIIPGQIIVSVTASLPGVGYNIPPSSFTIPGFKGGAKYAKIYAKSSADIAGGFVGNVKIVSPEDINKARATLSESLKQKLLKKAIVQVPSGYVSFDGAYFLSLKDNAIDNTYLSQDGSNTVQYKLSGNLTTIIIDEKSLNDYILSDKLSGSDNSNVIVRGVDKLSMTVLSKDKIDIKAISTLTTRLSGPIELIWDFDQSLLANKLAGIKISNDQQVFKEFPSVKKTIVKVSPSWAWSFPDDVKKIKIIKDFEQSAVK